MSTGTYLHLHKSNPPEPGYATEYRVHHPDGTLRGFVASQRVTLVTSLTDGSGRVIRETTRHNAVVWTALDESGSILAEGLDSRERAVQWVSER